MNAFASPIDELEPDLQGLDEQQLRELVERAFQLQELTRHPGWALFVDLVMAQTVTRQKLILSGACKTLEDYAQQTGWIKGAQAAVNGPAMVQQRLELFREQHEQQQQESLADERTAA